MGVLTVNLIKIDHLRDKDGLGKSAELAGLAVM